MAISIRRRELVLALGGVAATWPLAARAQQAGAVPRIGVVYPGPQAGAPPRVQAVLDGLRAGGYSQVEIVLRVADGDPSRISPLVTEVIASKVDVLFAIGPAVVQAAVGHSDPSDRRKRSRIGPGGHRLGRQPRASRWKYYGRIHGFPGFCHQMVGTVEGNEFPALSRRRSMGSIHGIISKKCD